MNCKIIPVALLAALSLHAAAEAVRSVDKDGNITFSDTPVAGSVESEEIRLDAPSPTQERVNESRREAQATIDRANRSQQQRDAASQPKKIEASSAKLNLENARIKLEKAKIVGAGDRKGRVGGGSRLTPEYLERVERAEQAVRDAE